MYNFHIPCIKIKFFCLPSVSSLLFLSHIAKNSSIFQGEWEGMPLDQYSLSTCLPLKLADHKADCMRAISNVIECHFHSSAIEQPAVAAAEQKMEAWFMQWNLWASSFSFPSSSSLQLSPINHSLFQTFLKEINPQGPSPTPFSRSYTVCYIKTSLCR